MTKRRLISSAEAKPAKSQHKKACEDCPWARHSLRGWLGSLTAEEWIALAHSDGTAECHAHTGVDCAGLAIYRANVLKRPRDPNAFVLPKDKETVFATPDEFNEHHTKAPEKPPEPENKTNKPEDQHVCANLECREPCDDDDFCFGCGFFICSEHSTEMPIGHGHDVIEHWEEPII